MNLSKKQEYGQNGERWVFEKLQAMGFDVVPLGAFNDSRGDLLVNGLLTAEVKIARQQNLIRPGRKTLPRWQWDCSTVGDDCALILIAEARKTGNLYPYIMPGIVMAKRGVFSINSHPDFYKGPTIGPYLNRWQTISEMLEYYKNQDLQAIMPAITA